MAKKRPDRLRAIAVMSTDTRFGKALAKKLQLPIVRVASRRYAAGERELRASRSVRGTVALVHDLEAEDANIWQACLAADALRNAGATRVILITPWMAFGRQDRPAATRASAAGPVLGRILSSAFDRIVTLEAHSRRFIEAFHGHLDSLSMTDLAAAVAKKQRITAIGAPDHGALDRARDLAIQLNLPFILCEKRRIKPGRHGVRIRVASGNPNGQRILLVDDMVDSGGTLAEAAKALRNARARSVGAVVANTANPHATPTARTLGLAFLHVLHPRKGTPDAKLLLTIKKDVQNQP
jgi:ribose-phosphate pyrophosphokinase